jgi:hypothetical protein
LLALTGESAEQAKADADATLRIETALANASLTRLQRRDPHNTYHMLMIVQSLLSVDPSPSVSDIDRLRRARSHNDSETVALEVVTYFAIDQPSCRGLSSFHARPSGALCPTPRFSRPDSTEVTT